MTLVAESNGTAGFECRSLTHDVFISYRSEDRDAAERLCAGLEGQGIRCWIAPRNIPIGTEWPTAIVGAIGACRVFVMVLSANSQNAKQISREAELADKNGCQIITFRIEDVQPPAGLTYFLGNIQWLDAFGGRFDKALQQMAEVIKASIGGTADAVKGTPSPTHGFLPVLDGRSAAPVEKKSVPWMGVAAGVAAALIGLGTWLGSSHKEEQRVIPQPTPISQVADAGRNVKTNPKEEMNEIQKFFEGWLTQREDGIFENPAQKRFTENGTARNQFESCTPIANGYNCAYQISYSNGRSEIDRVDFSKDANGQWRIQKHTFAWIGSK